MLFSPAREQKSCLAVIVQLACMASFPLVPYYRTERNSKPASLDGIEKWQLLLVLPILNLKSIAVGLKASNVGGANLKSPNTGSIYDSRPGACSYHQQSPFIRPPMTFLSTFGVGCSWEPQSKPWRLA